MTGPEFGCFSISIDSITIGIYNASTTFETYNTLLFFTTYLDASNEHTVKITNENDGMLLALDYFVAVQPGTSNRSGNTTISGSTTTSLAKGSTATADFGDGNTNSNQGSGGDSTAAIIGGILGGLGALVSLHLPGTFFMSKLTLIIVPHMVFLGLLAMEKGRRPRGTFWCYLWRKTGETWTSSSIGAETVSIMAYGLIKA